MGRSKELGKRNLFDELLELRDRQREQLKRAVFVVKGKELPWETNRQGKMRWYLHPNIENTAIGSLTIYVQEIAPASRSGRQKVQGGWVLYVWEGRGYSLVNGARHDWQERDVINLPLLPEGVEVQHFNLDAKSPAKLVVVSPNYVHMLGVDMGSGFEQLEDAPGIAEARAKHAIQT